MITIRRTGIALVIAAQWLFVNPLARAEADKQKLAAIVSPVTRQAQASCTGFASTLRQALLIPSRQKIEAGASRPDTLRRALAQHDEFMRGMCQEFQRVFKANETLVLSHYAAQMNGDNDVLARTFENAAARRWAAENARLLVDTASLVELYGLALALAPDLLDTFASSPRGDDDREINETSPGLMQSMQRAQLVTLLRDARFATWVPPGVDFAELRDRELRLRKESKRIVAAGGFSGTADEVAIRTVLSADNDKLLRELQPILQRYEHRYQQASRQ
ncbi:MAG: hypothetical protein EOP37_04570 [Rubrivivax sp.]|nr:MAG: hypothetical protein EOP37_04570 [Rubrivivax sp.]